jgi:two-component system phosphate regulon sensor histidine kinase PhoR
MPLDTQETPLARPALIIAPLLAVIPALWALGALSGGMAVFLFTLSAACGLWNVSRYQRDITLERRKARIDAARKPRKGKTPALLTGIVDGISDPLILLDRRRNVIHANKAALKLLGDNILGRDIAFYLRNPAALQAIEQAIAQGTPKEQEISLLDPVERDYLLRVNFLTAPDLSPDGDGDGGDHEYLILSIYDITRIKLAEKMRVDFVANASHELRTPLASILGFIETLEGPAARDEEARTRFLGIMSEEASRMQRLIDDLLSLSRIEMDQHVLPTGTVSLTPLIRGQANTLGHRAAKKQTPIHIEMADDLPPVQGDRDQLVQVFQNLMDNAIKYGAPGEAIDVRAELCPEIPNRMVPGIAVSVCNKGDPIPAEKIPRLTERFYRVDTARSRQLGGTGLGLAIVKHIINRHRGALRIESESGKGTTVTVFLPLTDREENQANSEPETP